MRGSARLNANKREFPPYLYGTAWKEQETRRLTRLAIQQGFRGIDTANQRKHYFEAAVGEGIADAIRDGFVSSRDDLFIQTKFTQRRGQDDRLPYDEKAPIREQVKQSFASSQKHLATEVLDSYVLHGPTTQQGLTEEDLEAWRSMEEIYGEGGTCALGISNISLDQLRLLQKVAQIKPNFVQIRCYAARQWDRSIRDFCVANGIVYQAFSLLTANRSVLNHNATKMIARRHGKTAAQIIFRFALECGMFPLTGTKDVVHMAEDLDVFNFQLSVTEVRTIETMVVGEKPQPFQTPILRWGR